MRRIPEPSWFLHWRGSGESRPELSGEADRLPDARSWAMVARGELKVGGRLQAGRSRLLRSVDEHEFHRCAGAVSMRQEAGKTSVVRKWYGVWNGGCLE